MNNVIAIRTPIQMAALELYHRYKGRYWFHNVDVKSDKIIIYYKKDKQYYEWLGNDDTYKSFKYIFKEQPEPFTFNTRLKK